jgi:hypothetical protein
VRYSNKPQALVDYAGILGAAHLRDGSGRLIASTVPLLPPHLRPSEDTHVFRVPGAVCREPGRHVLEYGGYRLDIVASAGLSPRAVKERLDNCRRLLRALANSSTSFVPPDHGSGGSGPAPAEIRVWRRRS